MSSRSSTLRIALAVLPSSARLRIALLGAFVAVERALLVAGALVLADEHRERALLVGVALVVLHGARAWLRSGLRVHAQQRMHRGAAAALLGADPLVTTPLDDVDAEVVLLEGVHHGGVLVADRVPSLLGDGIASLGIASFVAATQPAHVLAVAAVGAAAAAFVGIALRRVTLRAQDDAWRAYRPVVERVLVAVRGRAELVANGMATRFGQDLEARLTVFERETLRADRLSGLAGRAPLVAGALGVAVALVVQGRGSTEHAALADAALLASMLPAFLGFAQSAHETWKLSRVLLPMATLLALAPAPRGGARAVPSTPFAIALRDVGFRYPGATRDALAGVSLTFARGEPLVLSGPNGSGKSTVLRLLARLGQPSRGVVLAAGEDLQSIDVDAWRGSVAYLPQQPHLPEAMTVSDALRLFAPEATDEAMLAALERVEVRASLERRIAELSVGQRKRVALARLLLVDKPIVLLDEPDANLDADGVAMVRRLVAELATTRLVAVAAHTPVVVGAPGVHVALTAA